MSHEHALAVVSSTPLLFGTVKNGNQLPFFTVLYIYSAKGKQHYVLCQIRERAVSHIVPGHCASQSPERKVVLKQTYYACFKLQSFILGLYRVVLNHSSKLFFVTLFKH